MFSDPLYNDVTIADVLIVFVMAFFAFSFARGISIAIRRRYKDKKDKYSLGVIIKIINYSVFLFTMIIAIPLLGIKFSGLLVAGGITGIILGFASQKVVGNMISGIFLLIERPIKIGHQVQLDQKIGVVENITLLSTLLRTFDGLYVRVPNENVFTGVITNFVANPARRVDLVIGIRYTDDSDTAISIIKEVIEDNPLALIKPAPMVFLDEFGQNAVKIMVRAWAPSTEWYDMKVELLSQIRSALNLKGIDIALPQMVIWQGEQASPEANQ